MYLNRLACGAGCGILLSALCQNAAFASDPFEEQSTASATLSEAADTLGFVEIIDSPYLIDPSRGRPRIIPDEVAPPKAPPWTVSFTPYGVVGSVDAHSTHPGIEYWSTGALVGLDHTMSESLTIGMFAGLQYTRADTASLMFINEERQVQIGGFARHQHQTHHTFLSVKAGYNFYESQRQVPGGGRACGDYDGWETLLYAEHGVTFDLAPVNLQPYVGLQHYHMYTERFTETGEGAMNLTFPAARLHSLRSIVGARAQFPVTQVAQMQLLGEVRGGWSHEFLDTGFKTSPSELGRDAAVVGGTVTLLIDPTTILVLDYNANVSEHHREHVAFVMLRLSW